MTVRVRFAPSPTGALHVGSARTALFNWFFAKRHGGAFILRIEDTDQKRSSDAFLRDISEGLEFLGIRADEGPYFQSRRAALYQEHAERLRRTGQAVEEEGALVFRVAPQQVTFRDALRGDITVDTSLFETLVLMKSDGTPTYNFACVVDDAQMRITHVIRGDDHIANTPKQVLLFRALEYDLPVFAHIPLIVGTDRARLSKRTGATSVSAYREAGYLGPAFVNYLALLGWSPGENQEFVHPEDLIRRFELTKVNKTAAQFDQRKLDWLNSRYIKELPLPRLAELIRARVERRGWLRPWMDADWFERVAGLLRDRLKILEEVEEEQRFFFVEAPEYEEAAVAKFLRQPGMGARLRVLRERLRDVKTFDPAAVEQVVRGFVAEQALDPKQLIHPIRVAVTGREVSPPLFEVLSVLGRERVLARLDYAASMLTAQTTS